MLWNPYGDENMGYNNFICVESVKVRLDCEEIIESAKLQKSYLLLIIVKYDSMTLSAGESWEGVMSLRPN